MRVYRPIAPTPEGYFPNVRSLMEDAAIDEMTFTFELSKDQASDVCINKFLFGYYLEGFHEDALPRESYRYLTKRDTLGPALVMEAYKPKTDRIVAAAMALHPLILQRSPIAAESSVIHAELKAGVVHKKSPESPRGYHTDDQETQDWIGFIASDTHGTVHPSRLLRRPRTMPTNTINEFYPSSEHAEPQTQSDIPIPRTFVRLLYLLPVA